MQFSEEIQACAVIGQTGDLVGFRDCVETAYSGFEEDALSARAIADDTLDDVGKQCQAALRSYSTVLADYFGVVKTAYAVARQLEFDLLTPAYEALPAASRRYAKFSGNAIAACQPR